jgi:hypothetical protein
MSNLSEVKFCPLHQEYDTHLYYDAHPHLDLICFDGNDSVTDRDVIVMSGFIVVVISVSGTVDGKPVHGVELAKLVPDDESSDLRAAVTMTHDDLMDSYAVTEYWFGIMNW